MTDAQLTELWNESKAYFERRYNAELAEELLSRWTLAVYDNLEADVNVLRKIRAVTYAKYCEQERYKSSRGRIVPDVTADGRDWHGEEYELATVTVKHWADGERLTSGQRSAVQRYLEKRKQSVRQN